MQLDERDDTMGDLEHEGKYNIALINQVMVRHIMIIGGPGMWLTPREQMRCHFHYISCN